MVNPGPGHRNVHGVRGHSGSRLIYMVLSTSCLPRTMANLQQPHQSFQKHRQQSWQAPQNHPHHPSCRRLQKGRVHSTLHPSHSSWRLQKHRHHSTLHPNHSCWRLQKHRHHSTSHPNHSGWRLQKHRHHSTSHPNHSGWRLQKHRHHSTSHPNHSGWRLQKHRHHWWQRTHCR